MKKIIYLLTLSVLLISCNKSNDSDKATAMLAPSDLCAFLSTPLRSDMYSHDGQQNTQQLQCFGYSAIGDTTPEQWYFDLNSTATDNGTTVIQPTSMTGSGRWLFLYKVPSASKKQETFSGTTAGSGTYTVTFGTAYAVAPNIQANIINGAVTNTCRITSVSTTGFTVTANNTVNVLGLLPTFPTLNGAAIDVLVTQK